MSKNVQEKRFISKNTHDYAYNYPRALTLSIQKLINFAFKKFVEPMVKSAVIVNKEGKEAIDSSFIVHLNWIYKTAVYGGWIINHLLPRKLVDKGLNFFKKIGLEFSTFLMVGLPHQRFEKKASIIFIPESKNVELKTSEGKMVLPHYLVIEMLKRVCAYDPEHSIAQIYFCICRTTQGCQEHPRGLGCMIVGPGAVDVVDRNIGKYISLEDAIKQIETEIIPRGLSSFISVFPSDLHYIWGVKEHHSKYTFELCFCCTCCCVIKKPHFFVPRDPVDGKEPFIDIRGFRAQIDLKKCTGCGICAEFCPLERIKIVDMITKDGIVMEKATNLHCIGCGNCIVHCPNKAIEIVPSESFDRLEELLGIFEYYDLKKEEFIKKLNQKYQEANKKVLS